MVSWEQVFEDKTFCEISWHHFLSLLKDGMAMILFLTFCINSYNELNLIRKWYTQNTSSYFAHECFEISTHRFKICYEKSDTRLFVCEHLASFNLSTFWFVGLFYLWSLTLTRQLHANNRAIFFLWEDVNYMWKILLDILINSLQHTISFHSLA